MHGPVDFAAAYQGLPGCVLLLGQPLHHLGGSRLVQRWEIAALIDAVLALRCP